MPVTTVPISQLGEYICLLNNDVAPLDGGWLGEMMALARRPDVGAVGAKLFYPDGRIQHGGVILGVGCGAPAEHPYNGEPGNALGYWGRLQAVQNLSAVTAACLVTRRSVYEQVGGLDEETFAVAYNDVDYCLKVGAAGYLVLWTPFARLRHEASASLRSDAGGTAGEERNARFAREKLAMYRRWMPRIAFDPAYNRNLSSLGLGFAIETEGAPTWDPEFRPRPRVLVYPADREGCGEYRMIAPSRALFGSGMMHCYERMRLPTPPEVARIMPDSMVFQRQLEWHQIETIERVKNLSTAFRIFELDDLITNLPLKSVHRKAIAPDIRDRLKKALSLCDRLIVTGGLMLVTGAGPAQGLALRISPGVTGGLGEVTVSQGLYGGLTRILNGALADGTGSVTGEIKSLNDTVTSMNQRIAALQQQAQQETLTLTQQYGVAQATLSQLETVSNFLSTYFNQPSSGSGG